MHTISTHESGDGYRWSCSCGQVGNEYGDEGTAYSIGLNHKRYAEEEKAGHSPDDPHIGY